MLSGHATRVGGERFASRFEKGAAQAFYRPAQDALISNIGIGTYRGAIDLETDTAYAEAVNGALRAGINLVDTSLNYRQQRSERAVAAGIREFVQRSCGRRDEIVVCTKGGYLVPDAITRGTLSVDDVVGGKHCVAPSFLADQLDRSRRNLGLETIDVYYLHNPETQLMFVNTTEFLNRIRVAFAWLERAVADGLIRYYGTATWKGYFGGGLSLKTLAAMAREIAGDAHHFRFVQLPFNLAMREALTGCSDDGSSVLDLAAELKITVIASASLLQGRLTRLPRGLGRMIPNLASDAQRAIHFTRSTPGIGAALVGMSNTAHVTENLAVARIPPLTCAEYQLLFSTMFA